MMPHPADEGCGQPGLAFTDAGRGGQAAKKIDVYAALRR